MYKTFKGCAILAFLGGIAFSAPVWAQRVEGIDVSQFQGTMNFNTAYAAGARFAFIRAGRGGTTAAEGQQNDTTFLTNMANSANVKDASNQPVSFLTGIYLRARPDLSEVSTGQPTTGSLIAHADDEAQNLYNLSLPYLTPSHLRPVLDLESIPSDVPAHPGTVALDKPSMTLWANEFLDHFKSLSGIDPIIYVNDDYATNRLSSGINSPKVRDLWIARPFSGTYTSTSEPQTPSGFASPYGVWNIPANPDSSWDFWQHGTGTGSTYGAASTSIDLDSFNGDMNALQSFLIPEPTGLLLVPALALLSLRRRRR